MVSLVKCVTLSMTGRPDNICNAKSDGTLQECRRRYDVRMNVHDEINICR